MKLSEYKNEDALELLGDILEPLSEIMNDDEFKALIKAETNKMKVVQRVQQKHCTDDDRPPRHGQRQGAHRFFRFAESESNNTFWLCYGEYRGDRRSIKAFLRYCRAREAERREEKIFRLYVTDSLFYNSQNQRLVNKYSDLIKRQPPKKKKTAEEVTTDIITRHGLRFKSQKGGNK